MNKFSLFSLDSRVACGYQLNFSSNFFENKSWSGLRSGVFFAVSSSVCALSSLRSKSVTSA